MTYLEPQVVAEVYRSGKVLDFVESWKWIVWKNVSCVVVENECVFGIWMWLGMPYWLGLQGILSSGDALVCVGVSVVGHAICLVWC